MKIIDRILAVLFGRRALRTTCTVQTSAANMQAGNLNFSMSAQDLPESNALNANAPCDAPQTIDADPIVIEDFPQLEPVAPTQPEIQLDAQSTPTSGSALGIELAPDSQPETVAESVPEPEIQPESEVVPQTPATPSCSESLQEALEPLRAALSQVDERLEKLARIEECYQIMTRLQGEFETKFKYDKTKDEQIDKLYRENRKFRQDLLWSIKKDLILDVIGEIDDIEKRLPKFQDKEKLESQTREEILQSYDALLKFVVSIVENFKSTLERNDIFAYRAKFGEQYNPSRQSALVVDETNDPQLNGAVDPKRTGYSFEADGVERIVRKEMVRVFKYKAATETSDNTDEPATTVNEQAQVQENANAVPSETQVEPRNEPSAEQPAPTPSESGDAETDEASSVAAPETTRPEDSNATDPQL